MRRVRRASRARPRRTTWPSARTPETRVGCRAGCGGLTMGSPRRTPEMPGDDLDAATPEPSATGRRPKSAHVTASRHRAATMRRRTRRGGTTDPLRRTARPPGGRRCGKRRAWSACSWSWDLLADRHGMVTSRLEARSFLPARSCSFLLRVASAPREPAARTTIGRLYPRAAGLTHIVGTTPRRHREFASPSRTRVPRPVLGLQSFEFDRRGRIDYPG